MISYPAFFDELEKIAADNFVTKEKFKRHLGTVGAVGVGSGLGYASGKALKRYLLTPEMLAKFKKLPPSVRKYIVPASSAIGGAAGLARALVAHKTTKRIQEGK